jgi:glucose/arabinose dehydrogenase
MASRIQGAALFVFALLASTCTALAQSVRQEVVAADLQNPWAVAFLPDGRFLVTERPGRMRVIEANDQGGLLDVIPDTDFRANRTLFFCFSEPGLGGNSTALARARLSTDFTRLEEVKIIFSQHPKVTSTAHFGCRIVESQTQGKPDGMLYMTLGERFSRKARLAMASKASPA